MYLGSTVEVLDSEKPVLEIPKIIERISDALKVGVGIVFSCPFKLILEDIGECDKEITERVEDHHHH